MKPGRPCFQTKNVKGVIVSCSFFLPWTSDRWDNRNNKSNSNSSRHRVLCVQRCAKHFRLLSCLISTTAQGTVILALVLCKQKRSNHVKNYTSLYNSSALKFDLDSCIKQNIYVIYKLFTKSEQSTKHRLSVLSY